MHQIVSTTQTDPMGAAILEYYQKGKAAKLRVFSSMFEEDEIPVSTLFRTYEQMPKIEQTALRLAQGRILDVGAGSGCHTLALEEMQKEVTALDISPLSIQTMHLRGIQKVIQQDFFSEEWTGSYDTILMLMNGAGIVGSRTNLPRFFDRIHELLSAEGIVLLDSCDLRYVFEDEDGNFDASEFDHYYGEVDYRMKYRNIVGEPFDWLYIDFDTLAAEANKHGFIAECVEEGENMTYLAKIRRKNH